MNHSSPVVEGQLESSALISRPTSAALASAVFIVPLALSWSTSPAPQHPRVLLWYTLLSKPDYKPSDWAIPVTWGVIETAMAVAAYRLIRQPQSAARNKALALLALNTVSIGGWSRVFFGSRSLPVSTVAAAAMIGSGAAYIEQARKVDKQSALAGIPFVAWVAFATLLTAELWRRNR